MSAGTKDASPAPVDGSKDVSTPSPSEDPIGAASDAIAASFMGGGALEGPSTRHASRKARIDRRTSYEVFDEGTPKVLKSRGEGSNSLPEISEGREAEEVAGNNEYKKFLEEYPSLHTKFSLFKDATQGKKLAVFLDYDGTLTPIVKDPDMAIMSEETRASVKVVATNFPCAIISGRGRDKVFDFVKLEEMYYAGSHGLDIVGPKAGMWKSELDFQPAKDYMETITTVHGLLVDRVKDIPGANVENNKFCTSVHFRNCAPESWEEVVDITESTVGEFSTLKITRGRKVLEVRPKLEWDKGKALYYLVEALGLDKMDDVVSIYIGDDRTDEDAFKVLYVCMHPNLSYTRQADVHGNALVAHPPQVLSMEHGAHIKKT